MRTAETTSDRDIFSGPDFELLEYASWCSGVFILGRLQGKLFARVSTDDTVGFVEIKTGTEFRAFFEFLALNERNHEFEYIRRMYSEEAFRDKKYMIKYDVAHPLSRELGPYSGDEVDAKARDIADYDNSIYNVKIVDYTEPDAKEKI